MALLLRWLHPDRETNGARTIYVGRITEAWNNIKTAERRSAYDAVRRRAASSEPPHSSPGSGASSAAGKGRVSIRRATPPSRTRAAGSTGRRRRARRRGRLWRLLERLLGQVRP
jgi:DnaJ-class molecular chaperone